MPATSITLNLKKIQPALWMLIFLFLPLERYTTVLFRGESSWNIVPFLWAAALCFIYIYEWQQKKITFSTCKAALAVSLILFFAVVTGSAGFSNRQALLLLLLAIWSASPLFNFIRQQRQLALYIVVSALTVHGLWALGQFALQQDLHLNFLGETKIKIGEPGVATFNSVHGTKVARAYGPYPHPNILGGSMLLGFIVLISRSHRRKDQTSTPVFIISYFLGLAVLISFSRAAWIGLLLLFLVACLTPTKKIRAILVLTTLITFTPFLLARGPHVGEVAVTERVAGSSYALALLKTLPVWHGVGPGNYEHILAAYFMVNHIPHEPWDIAPVHTVPLLLLTEWGMLPTIVLVAFLLFSYGHGFVRTWPLLLPIIPLLANSEM